MSCTLPHSYLARELHAASRLSRPPTHRAERKACIRCSAMTAASRPGDWRRPPARACAAKKKASAHHSARAIFEHFSVHSTARTAGHPAPPSPTTCASPRAQQHRCTRARDHDKLAARAPQAPPRRWPSPTKTAPLSAAERSTTMTGARQALARTQADAAHGTPRAACRPGTSPRHARGSRGWRCGACARRAPPACVRHAGCAARLAAAALRGVVRGGWRSWLLNQRVCGNCGLLDGSGAICACCLQSLCASWRFGCFSVLWACARGGIRSGLSSKAALCLRCLYAAL